MATKRVSPVKKAAKAAPPTVQWTHVDRHQLVSMEAYFLAERRGFIAGHEHEDWLAAEAVVDSRSQRIPIE